MTAVADSLLSAIVRAGGDALVMHVGERPYVMVGTSPLQLSASAMSLDAMTRMIAQLLSRDALAQLDALGVVEQQVADLGADRFSIVVARGGDDIWIEIRRRRNEAATPLESALARLASSRLDPAHLESSHPPSLEPLEPLELLEPASVRTVRIEVPDRPAPATRTTEVERLLRVAAGRGAAALFLISDARPCIRVEGDLQPLDAESILTRAGVEAAIAELAPARGREAGGPGDAAEWVREFADLGQLRCATFRDHRGPGVIVRMGAARAATAEQLRLPRAVQALAAEPQGLVLVAGPRASGKSTLVSALVDLVNRRRAGFVITLERQIRLVHDHRCALVSQREIRGGTAEALAAARAALREGPDVLVVDDLLSAPMVPLLLTAASEGRLIVVSMTAASTRDALERFVGLVPPAARGHARRAAAESFRGAVAQLLLRKTGGGVVAAREVLLAAPAVSSAIAEGQLAQLSRALDSGRALGMVSFADALVEAVRSGAVDVREALRQAPDRERLLAGLEREGVDTSAIDRLT